MTSIARQLRLFCFALSVVGLSGCSAGSDDPLPPSEPTGAAESQALIGATVDTTLEADADCEALALGESAPAGTYGEFLSVLESSTSTELQAAPGGSTGSTCTRVCKCCKERGNRFCCSHCRFCSGPIGVSDGVLTR